MRLHVRIKWFSSIFSVTSMIVLRVNMIGQPILDTVGHVGVINQNPVGTRTASPSFPGLDHCASQLDTCGSIDPNAQREEVRQHEMILVVHKIQHNSRRRKCAVHHRGYLCGIRAEAFVVPAVYPVTRTAKPTSCVVIRPIEIISFLEFITPF